MQKNSSNTSTEVPEPSLFERNSHLLTDRRSWYVAAVIIVVIVLYSMMSPGERASEGLWAPVINDTFYVDIIESGEIRAVNSYNVQAPSEWRMELQITRLVKEGTLVQEGDFLAQFDASALIEELDTAKDQLKAQEAELLSVETKQESKMAQFASDLIMAEYSREASELQLGLLKFESEVRKEDARLSYQKALISFDETKTKISAQKIMDKAEMGRVMQTLKYRQNNVDDLNRRIEQLTLKAPTSGMVVYNEIGGWRGTPKHKISEGETVWPRMTVIQIPDLSEMESVVRVNEIDASKIRVGKRSQLRLDAFEDKVFTGKVLSIAPLADKANSEEESHIKDFEVIIRIEESDQVFKPGMSSKTQIILEEIPGVTYVPIGAVFEVDGQSVVYPRKGYPKPVEVKLGKRNDRFIIVEGDIDTKDEIALLPPNEDSHPLGWYAEMERKASEKEELLGHLNKMEADGIVEKIEERAAQKPKEVPPQFKRLADMLEKAGHPLTEEQIDKIAALDPGPDSRDKMTELLNEEQKKVISDMRGGAGGGSGGRPGR
ncbi:efflux RND transporter periplasmic adaptor subunit [Candidatus Latescibacterota bacterium]